jgi:hypothetical protein
MSCFMFELMVEDETKIYMSKNKKGKESALTHQYRKKMSESMKIMEARVSIIFYGKYPTTMSEEIKKKISHNKLLLVKKKFALCRSKGLVNFS